MESILTDEIVRENDFTLITKLDENTKQYLKEHIQNSILDRYNYQPLKHIQEMIDTAIVFFEDDLQAINYIQTINYTIDDKFYEKLKEEYFDCNDETIYDWEDEFEKPKEAQRLNKYTLSDFIDISFIDGIDLMAEQFEDINKNHPQLDIYKQAIKENLELLYKHKNHENIKLKKDLEPLTKREINLITANAILILNKSLLLRYKEKIANDYNIKNNTPQKNQELLNNSYDVIIEELKKINPNEVDCIDLIEQEKNINSNLFVNPKILTQLKNNNHYMKFLYKCNSAYTQDYDKVIFSEFVESLINGYTQYLELKNSDTKKRIKEYEKELKVLEKYNRLEENKKNIEEITNYISFLSIKKSYYKFVIFKELSNKLEIQVNEIANYILNTSMKKSHNRNTILNNFNIIKAKKQKTTVRYL